MALHSIQWILVNPLFPLHQALLTFCNQKVTKSFGGCRTRYYVYNTVFCGDVYHIDNTYEMEAARPNPHSLQLITQFVFCV